MKGVVIIAAPRTGTNWLSGILASSTNARNLREVFHPEVRLDGNFFDWMQTRMSAIPFDRSHAWTKQVINEYANYIENEWPIPLLDFKYTSFSAFEPSWRSPVELPIFLKVFMERNYRFIHLKRQSALDTAVSEYVAINTSVWWADKAIDNSHQITADIPVVLSMAKRYLKETTFVDGMLAGYQNLTSVYYEQIVSADREGHLMKLILDLISGSELTLFELKQAETKKVLPDWRRTISNSSALEEQATLAGIS